MYGHVCFLQNCLISNIISNIAYGNMSVCVHCNIAYCNMSVCVHCNIAYCMSACVHCNIAYCNMSVCVHCDRMKKVDVIVIHSLKCLLRQTIRKIMTLMGLLKSKWFERKIQIQFRYGTCFNIKIVKNKGLEKTSCMLLPQAFISYILQSLFFICS